MVSVFDDSRRQSTSVFSQPDGIFRIEGLYESEFKIRARLPGQQDGWMEAHLWVMDHPFYAVTNTEGEFEILDLPPGNYVVSAWHEKLGEQSEEITVHKGGSISNFKFRIRSELLSSR